MQSGLTITEHEYWQNTIKSVESSYCWLTSFEGKNYSLVDDAIIAMRNLTTFGKSVEQMKNYKATTTTTIAHKRQSFQPFPVNYNMDPNWKRIDDNTIYIDLGENNGTAIAIAVNTEEQFEDMIKDIYSAPYIAVDCEFLGQRKTLPELKLLQIGVSTEKGYAIQVDKIGVDLITDKLKPILESQELTVIGWSFRSDALAIECYMKGVELAPVLDLQAKLKPIAVEQLNLATAMSKFAADWVGQQEFQKAKQYGNQFNFTGENCIWVHTPLPPRALVYAVFDVLSVVALYESTLQYDSAEAHFWPFTITLVESPKVVENWHRLRAKGINSNSGSQSLVNIVPSSTSPSSSSPNPRNEKEKARDIKSTPKRTTITTLGDGYDDENEEYQRNIQKAIAESTKSFYKEKYGAIKGESSSTNDDRIISSEDISYSDIATELDANGTTSHHANTVFSTYIPEKASNVPEIVEGSWGTKILDEQPFIGGKFLIDNKEIDARPNKSPLNVASLAFAPRQKRTSVSKSLAMAKSLGPRRNSFTSPSHQPKYNNDSTATVNQQPMVSPQLNKHTPKVSPQVNQPTVPVSRWNNEPTPPSAQWNEKPETTGSQWGSKGPEVNGPQWGSKKPKESSSVWGKEFEVTGSQWNNQESTTGHWGDKPNQGLEKQSNDNAKKGWGDDSIGSHWGGSAHTNLSSTKYWGDDNNTNTKLSNNQWSERSRSTSYNNNNNATNHSVYTPPQQCKPLPSAFNKSNNRSPAINASRPSPRATNASLQSAHTTLPLSAQSSSYKSSPNTFKPNKAKYTSEFKSRITMGNQGGSFTNYQPVGNEMSSASWKCFANSTEADWRKGLDTPLDAIDKPVVTSDTTTTTTTDATSDNQSIKFNTTAQVNYPRGVAIGDSYIGKMHQEGEEEDAWTRREELPDTMQMPMNQIPIRKEFSGPRVMNPDDELESDEDDDDYFDDYDDLDLPVLKMNKMSTIQDTTKFSPQAKSLVQQLPTYVDGTFLYGEDGDGELSILRLNAPEHLDMINIPPPGTDYTATVCYHFVTVKENIVSLKAIQLYLSTGESYTAIIEQCCFVNNREHTKKSKFGFLLTDPSVKRICWFPQYIEKQMMEKVGFPIGPCVDLSYRANDGIPDNNFMSFSQALERYLRDWPDKNLFEEAKKDFDSLNGKKFSSCCWDRERLPDAVLQYSALQGLTAYALYLETLKQIKTEDENFMYEY